MSQKVDNATNKEKGKEAKEFTSDDNTKCSKRNP